MPLSGNKIRFTRNVLYRLKRDYGLPADFYHQSSEAFDLTTGRQTPVIDKQRVRRAVLLPKTSSREDAHATTQVGEARNFSYGGEFGTIVREMLVDKRDLKAFTLDDYVNIYVIIGGDTRYEITEYEELHGIYYYLKLKATPGAQLARQVELEVEQSADITQDAEGTT